MMNPCRPHLAGTDRSLARGFRARRSLPRSPAGFTLVELLVVIGIILLLIGIAVVGFNQIDRVVSAKATKTAFQNLQGMVDEFATINGTGLLESYWTASMTGVPKPVYVDSSTTSFAMATAPSDVSNPSTRYSEVTVQNTQQVIERLSRIPLNKQSLANMPTKSLLPPPPGQTTPLNPSVLVDAWRNPIIFVPAGGLTNVTLNYGTAQAQTVTIKSPDNRPFWASAGPDGDFSKGDDNVYSFQN